MGRAIRGWLVATLVIAGVGVALRLTLLQPRPVDVRVIRVGRGTVEETITSTKAGSLRSRWSADVSVDAAGPIVGILAREGDRVRRGDHLLSVDQREASATYTVACRDLNALQMLGNEASARLVDAEREHRRLADLAESGVVTTAELDQSLTKCEVAKASLAAAQARVAAQEAQVARGQALLEKCDVHAPFDGIIAELYVEVGEWATPGQVVLRILDPNQLYVRAELDEVDIAELNADLPIRVILDPYKDRKIKGRILRIAPYVSEVEEQNRTIEIEVALVDGMQGLDLKPGTSADVEVVLRAHHDVLRVPTAALMDEQRVMRVTDDDRAESTPVRVGLKNWEYAEVQGGLHENDRVVVSLESAPVQPGARLRITQPEQR